MLLKGVWVRLNPYDLLSEWHDEGTWDFSGVYVLYGKQKQIIYVGSSLCGIKRRLLQHCKTHKEELRYIKVRKDKERFECLTLEARLIYRLKPPYNKMYNNKSLINRIPEYYS